MILHYGDLTDSTNLVKIVSQVCFSSEVCNFKKTVVLSVLWEHWYIFSFLQVKPDEIYNLGAQSHVKVSLW